MRFRSLTVPAFLVAILGLSCGAPPPEPAPPDWRDEVVYHVFVRSFQDSNLDGHGDLRGLTARLPYLKELGVTALLLLPVVESPFYHNYFPTDYDEIDPEYGTMDDWTAFVRAAHAAGLKVLMDMETQYATTGHPWLDEAWRNPASRTADFVAWTDSVHENVLGFYGIDTAEPTLPYWPDRRGAIVHLDLNADTVRAWTARYFAHWADPNGDGVLDDGVDGYRIDHIMDDLDNRGVFTDLYARLWRPALDSARTVRPGLFVVGEQADWASFGEDMMERSGADAAFAFGLRFTLADLLRPPDAAGTPPVAQDSAAARLSRVVSETMRRTPAGKTQVTFLENHDTSRWASEMASDDRLVRMGAVLLLTLPGLPSIYYGQELGLTGVQGTWGTDANDIPIREAFPWTAPADSNATWYRGDGPFWQGSIYATGASDALALNRAQADSASTWHLYRRLIAWRKDRSEWRRGTFVPLPGPSQQVLTFAREADGARTVVVANLSDSTVSMDPRALGILGYRAIDVQAASNEDPWGLGPKGYAVMISPPPGR